MTRVLLLACSLPATLASWLAALLLLCGFAERPRWTPGLVLAVRWRAWVGTRFSVTLGRAVIYTPRAYDATVEVDTPTEQHEHVHVRQVEDESLKATLLAAVLLLAGASPWLALAMWCSAGLWLFVHNLAAVLRYGVGGIYREAEHERSAYAQTDTWIDDKHVSSWLTRHERDRALSAE